MHKIKQNSVRQEAKHDYYHFSFCTVAMRFELFVIQNYSTKTLTKETNLS